MSYLGKDWQTVTGERCGAVHLCLLAFGVRDDGPHGGHGAAQLRPAAGPAHPRVPLVHTCYPADAEHRHSRQQILHYAHELPPVHRHRSNYAITIIDKIVPFIDCRKLHVVRVRRRVLFAGSRRRARMRSGRATMADCAQSADSVSTMRPLRLIVLNASTWKSSFLYQFVLAIFLLRLRDVNALLNTTSFSIKR